MNREELMEVAPTVSLDALRTITDRQIRVVKRIRQKAVDSEVFEDEDFYEIDTFAVTRLGEHKTIIVHIEISRTDCDEYSPRRLLTGIVGRFYVGPRGGVRVCTVFGRNEPSKAKLKKYPMIYGFRHGLS